MSKTLGIDLGTTNSVVAVMEGGQAKVITSSEGSTRIPSVVDMEKNVVGEVAKRQLVVAPKTTIYSVKRLMGRKASEPEVQNAKSFLSYEIGSGQNDAALVKIDDKTYTPQEISAKILTKLKQDAESYLGEPVTSAVITVPAYFNDAQRQATKQAGEIAGLDVKRIINEPTAAALAYGLDKTENETIAVYDLGGGTFDISILEVGDGVFEVKSTNGDTHLGGDDFDEKIITYLAEQFQKDNGLDLRKDKQALQRLKDAAEKAKVELSTKQEAEINIPFITADQTGPKHLQVKLTRATFEHLVDELVTRTFTAVEKALKDASLTKTDIDEVILVGGQTRMPYIQQKVAEYFGKETHKGVNPDEVVAIGAAIQAGILGGEIQDVVLLDVTPLTLGIETLGGVMTPIIERNTTIPAAESQVFSTAADNQTSVEIHVLQGERSIATENKPLGRFILSGIPPAARGIPQIEVTFDIDSNGILNVSAKDKATGTEQKITIQNTTDLSQDEVERMKKEAELHADDDKKYKENIEVKNQAESLVYSTEKTLKEHGEKLEDSIKQDINTKVEAVKAALQEDNPETLKQKMDELGQAVQQIGEAMYKQTNEEPQNTEENPDPETVDGTATEQEEKDNTNKE